jgi:hypothetical protein
MTPTSVNDDKTRREIEMPANISALLIGPHGLYAVLAAALILFAGFLFVFNFTTFF